MTEIEKEYYRCLALQEEYGGTNKPVNKIIPLVSVVTITYQHVPYIRQCLDGILMQKTDFPYEIIIGEDGSTDGTREICIEYANKYPDKIRLFLRDRKLTQYVTKDGRTIRFNGHFAIAAARGKYVAFCEGDDYWVNQNKLQMQVNQLDKDKECVLCGHNAIVVDQYGTPLYAFSNINRSKYVSSKEIIKKWIIPTCSILYRQEQFEMPSWALDVPNSDIIIQLMLSFKGKVYYFNNSMGAYRRHPGSMTEYVKRNMEEYIDTQIILNIRLIMTGHFSIWKYCFMNLLRYCYSKLKVVYHNRFDKSYYV